MKRMTAILLAVLLLAASCTGCAEQVKFMREENTGWDKDSYPYLVRTPYAVWHLSKADMELLGEDAYCERSPKTFSRSIYIRTSATKRKPQKLLMRFTAIRAITSSCLRDGLPHVPPCCMSMCTT